MPAETIRRYQNRTVKAAQVVEELIQLARELREADARGEELKLLEDELAFYDALETNDSAVKVLDDETLRDIARELLGHWQVQMTARYAYLARESVKASAARVAESIESDIVMSCPRQLPCDLREFFHSRALSLPIVERARVGFDHDSVK